MKKILLITLLGAGFVAFVGADAVSNALHRARAHVRDHLTRDLPLDDQLAQARARVDAYAESIIRGEVAAENLDEMIAQVEREVRVLEVRVTNERDRLASLRDEIEMVAVADVPAEETRDIRRRAARFRAQATLLERRRADLERLREERQATHASLEAARTEQARLAEEVLVLAAEIESLEARTAAARTREAVGDASVDRSGFAEAQERLQKIRDQVRERNKLLEYYTVERRPVLDHDAALEAEVNAPADARDAIEEALAAFPATS